MPIGNGEVIDGWTIGSFGYVGDGTPDHESLRGVGAYNHNMTPYHNDEQAANTIISVGLSTGAQKAHNLSRGSVFKVGPYTFRVDDTNNNPGQENYIDLYYPSHRPDRGHEGDAGRLIAGRTEADWAKMRGDGGALNVIGWQPGYMTENTSSLLSQYRDQFPEDKLLSNDTVLSELRDTFSPGMDQDKFRVAATAPGGIADIYAYRNSPLGQWRSLSEENAKMGDLEAARAMYEKGVELGKIDKEKESFEEFRERFAPDNSWQAQTTRFAKTVDAITSESIRQVVPQTEELGLKLYSGVHQIQATAAIRDLDEVMDLVHPAEKEQNGVRVQQLAQMTQPQAEAYLRKELDQSGPDLINRLAARGYSTEKLFDRLDAGLVELKSKDANEAVAKWADALTVKVDKNNPGNLPENQEKVAKIIAQTPAQVLMGLVPGLREVGNYSQLYKQNYDQIKADHPDWDTKQVDDRARRAADAQMPAQEILSLLMVKGLPQVKAGLTAMIMRGGVGIVTSAGVGGLTLSANQVIQNIADDKPPMSGVSDNFWLGTAMGTAGRATGMILHGIGSNLTVSNLKRAFLASPQIRRAMGVSDTALTSGPQGTLALLNGEKSPADTVVEHNATDMLLGGLKQIAQKTTEQGIHKGVLAAGEEEKESPVVEAYRKAVAARESGDMEGAQKYIDQALSLATPTQRDILDRSVAYQLRVVTHSTHPPETIAKPQPTGALEPEVTVAGKAKETGQWTSLMPGQVKEEIPKGAETRVNPLTGLTEYKLPAKSVSDEPVKEYFGTNNPPKTEVIPPKVDQVEHSFPSGHIQTRPNGEADLYLENGVKLTFPDVGDAIEARKTIRGARTRKWEARSSEETEGSGETITESELSKAPPPAETAVPPKTELEQQLEASIQARQPAQQTAQGRILEAYQALKAEQGGLSAVSIGALASRSGVPIPELHKWLLDQAKKGGVDLHPTTLIASDLNPLQQAGALKVPWDSEPMINATLRPNEIQPELPTVSVGNMKGLKVVKKIPNPQGGSTQTLLQDPKTGRYYLRTPGKGLTRIEPEEESGYALGLLPNPFPQMRAAKRWAGEHAPGWQKTEQWTREKFAPYRLSEEARDVAAIAIRLNTEARTSLQIRLHDLAIQANMDKVLNNMTESGRREAWYGNKTDGQLRQYLLDWLQFGTTGNKDVDDMLRFNSTVRKYYNYIAQNSGVTKSEFTKLFTQAFKNPAKARIWYDEQLHQSGGKRIPTFEEAIAAGAANSALELEPRTYNPERLMLTHATTVLETRKEIEMMHQMVSDGYATLKPGPKDPPVPWKDEFPAADGHTYVMSPEVFAVVKNMMMPNRLYDALPTTAGNFFATMRGVLYSKLSWSQFHQIHEGMGIVPAEAATEYMMRVAKGLGRPGETVEALKSAGEGYWSVGASAVRMIAGPLGLGKRIEPALEKLLPSLRKYGSLIDVMQGRASASSLTQIDRINFSDLMGMGITARPSHERYMQWSGFMQLLGKKPENAVNWAYKALTGAGFGQFYFGRVLPSLKIAAALRRRDTVFRWGEREGINLRDPANVQRLRYEYQKINRDIEGRFGEVLYDNLFWDKTAKAIGMQTQLSLAWNLGMFRVHGDAVQDLSDNALNMDRIAAGTYKNAELVTNRMLYAMNYWAIALATGAATSVLIGGVDPRKLQWMDYLNPKIGTKPGGDDERIRTPQWNTELFNYYEAARKSAGGNLWTISGFLPGVLGAVEEFSYNKLLPGFHSLWDLANNKDFKNRQIADDLDPPYKQAADIGMFWLRDMLMPIGIESIATPNTMSNKAKIFALLGFGPAPAWTRRTAFENMVIYKAERAHPEGIIGHDEGAYFDARTDYMIALQTKDPQAISDSLKAWINLGADEKKIQNANKEVLQIGQGKIKTALNMFRRLDDDPKMQLHLLELCPKEDFFDYFAHASHEAQNLWRQKHGPLTADQAQ